MNIFKIKYLPQARWQLIIGNDASPVYQLDQPIVFGNHIALSTYYDDDEFVVKIGEIIPKSMLEIVDESWPGDMNEDDYRKDR